MISLFNFHGKQRLQLYNTKNISVTQGDVPPASSTVPRCVNDYRNTLDDDSLRVANNDNNLQQTHTSLMNILCC